VEASEPEGSLEGGAEVEDVVEVVNAIAWLGGHEFVPDEGVHDVAEVVGRLDAPGL